MSDNAPETKNEHPLGSPENPIDIEMIGKVIQVGEEARKALAAADDKYEKIAKAQEEAAGKLEKAEEHLSRRIDSVSDFLKTEHGPSGADDWKQTFAKFMIAARADYRGHACPDHAKSPDFVIEKAAVDFTTTTSATAGYLVPEILMPDIYVSEDIYGTVLPLCNRITVPAGQNVKINARSTDATPYWRKSQAVAMTENEFVYAQASARPVLNGSYIKVANELFDLPSVGTRFVENGVESMVRAILKNVETGILQGDDNGAGDDTDPPSDGILTATSGTTDETTGVSAATIAGHGAFVAACCANYDALYDTNGVYLILPPDKVMALAQEAVATAAGSTLAGVFAWGDPVTGAPGMLFGYNYVTHPQMTPSAAWAIMCKPKKDIVVADSGRLAIDFNPLAQEAWEENETWIRTFTHHDWAFPKAANIQKGDYA